MHLNTNLTILQELNGDFDVYLVLFHLSTGSFVENENGQVFDVDQFKARFPGLCKRSPQAIMRALNYSGHIHHRPDNTFTVSRPERFSLDDLTLPQKQKKEPAPSQTKTRLLKSCEALAHFNSAAFIEAWRDYEEVMTKKKKPRTQNTTKLGAAELLKLSGGDERLATLIVQQSTNGGWPGFFPLKQKENSKPKNAATYYDNGNR